MPETILDYNNSQRLSAATQDTAGVFPYSQGNHSPMPASLPDPSARLQKPFNGITSLSSHFSNPTMRPRFDSEPPSAYYPTSAFESNVSVHTSKDDAHDVTQGHNRASSKTSKTPDMLVPQSKLFDARQLLDPKGYNPNRQTNDDKTVHMLDSRPSILPTTNDAQTKKRSNDELEGHGMGNMIERIHGVSHRDEHPSKKQKKIVPTDEDEKKAAFTSGGKGGEIGEYMRQKRIEAQTNAVPCGEVVDLTAGRSRVYHGCYAQANLVVSP